MAPIRHVFAIQTTGGGGTLLLTLLMIDVSPVTVEVESDCIGIPVTEHGNGRRIEAPLQPGTYRVRVYEPPRSVVISWDACPGCDL